MAECMKPCTHARLYRAQQLSNCVYMDFEIILFGFSVEFTMDFTMILCSPQADHCTYESQLDIFNLFVTFIVYIAM